MKIDDVYKNMTLINSSKEAPGGRKAEAPEGTNQEGEPKRTTGTEVIFSETSVEFSRALEAMEKDSVERARKVDEIRTRVEEGAYEVDAAKVADKMLREVLADLADS